MPVSENTKSWTRNHFNFFCFLLTVLLIVIAITSFNIGRFSGVTFFDTIKILLSKIIPNIPKSWTSVDEGIVIHLRLPRIVAAIVVGASLAVSGVSYQALFNNPVASSDTLGVTSGASFGAIVAILMGFSTVGVKVLAFAVGCVAVFLAFFTAALLSKGKNMTVYLILIGMVISSLFSALLSILKFVADPEDQLPKITYWLMGSFGGIKATDLPYCIILFAIALTPLIMLRWRMNLLSLSDYEAKSMGENIWSLRMTTVICATLLTSASVAITGGVSWVGLVIPHIARLLVGYDLRKLFPVSALIGSIFMLVVDNIARSVSVYELPISVLTSLIGAPLFFFVLLKNREHIANGD